MSSVTDYRGREFTLEELVSVAESVLSALAGSAHDGRISALPDIRTIRFYQSSGVLEKPLRYDGRKAIYGYGHLLQIVCVKKLQAEGYPLSVIQRALVGRTSAELEEKLSLLPAAASPRVAGSAPPAGAAGGSRYRSTISTEVAPGLTLSIDPARFRDPEKILSEFATVLADLLEKTL